MRKAAKQTIGCRRPGRRSAAAAVEFAFLAPVLLVLLGGLWEIGRMVEV
jgi:Flp pilus assembly protein TadG